MKIYGNKPTENQNVYLKAQKADKNEAAEKSALDKSGSADRVELSGKAREIAELKNTVDQMPDIRSEKVEKIEKAILEGNYKIDSKKIAGKMIDELV